MTSSFLTFALALVLALTTVSRVDACFSEGRRELLMKEYEKDAKALGMTKTQIACLLHQGEIFEPVEHEVHGQVFKCYHDEDYSKHMVHAMEICGLDMSDASERTLVTAENQLALPKPKERVLRRPIEPSTPMRKVAHWLGLKETVRQYCSCTSGCHFCCVNISISGDDFCFRLHCRGVGYCS